MGANAAANNVGDHTKVLDAAIEALPPRVAVGHRPGDDPASVVHQIRVRTDSAGNKSFANKCRERNVGFSVGTRRARSDDRYIEDIVEGFRWLGLDWDEGIEVGGPYGTYRQSDRFGRYREVAERFVDDGRAYYDFRSAEKLDGLRSRARREKKPPGYYIRRPPVATPKRGGAGQRPVSGGVVRFSTLATPWSSPIWSAVRCCSSRALSTIS